ncbi:DNA-directed RNA polymerase III subunit RPC3 [Chionoecetes opilio]|uniref:DNA-directed RNA polymerase III subunit RPC3 n=1 Tax=Chionoecetes opilio TaxID=41210 RepID=A0A8J4XQV7_CHIOP|nr:DNA-directed RNA polymerase III subunit RPC3 [Chionoecetes opilio]
MLKISYTRSDPWDSTLNPVTLAEIRDHLKDLKHLEQYLKVLEEESGGAVRRVGDVGGGQYRLELGEAYRTLTHTLVYQIVQERLGGKAARIFRLIHRNGMMEQDQRDTTHADNTRLLDKRIRVDSIVENLRQSGGTEEQVREVEEMMTEAEVKQVEKVSSTQDRLFDSEIGLDETMFILQMFGQRGTKQPSAARGSPSRRVPLRDAQDLLHSQRPLGLYLNPVTLAEIRDHLKDLKHLEQYLKVLEGSVEAQ